MPTRQMTHIDRALTNMSVAFIQSEANFIATKAFPSLGVQKQSDRYFVYLKADWFRDEAQRRAPATESAGGGYSIDNTPNYFAEVFAYHKDVTESDRVNSDTPLNADVDANEFCYQKVLLNREVNFATNFFTPGVGWGTQMLGAVATNIGANQLQFWNTVGSDPIGDVTRAKLQIASQTGFRPNTLTIGANVYETLRNHDDILGRIVFSQRGVVTAEILAQLFDVDTINVGWAVQNVANRGAAENTNFLLGNHALLTYNPARPGIKTPAAGYTFAWTGLMGANAYGGRSLRIPMPILGIGTERIEVELAYDQRMVAADLGYFMGTMLQ